MGLAYCGVEGGVPPSTGDLWAGAASGSFLDPPLRVPDLQLAGDQFGEKDVTKVCECAVLTLFGRADLDQWPDPGGCLRGGICIRKKDLNLGD